MLPLTNHRATNLKLWILKFGRKGGPYIISLAILVGCIWYAYLLRFDFSELDFTQISFSAVVVLVILHILNLTLASIIFKTLVDHLAAGPNLSEYLSLTVVTNLMSYLSPGRLGAVGKGVYLKRRIRLSYGKFSSYFLGQSIFMAMTVALVGIVATQMMSVSLSNTTNIDRLFFFFGALFVISSIPMIWMPSLSLFKKNRLLRFINLLTEGWNDIRTSHRLVVLVGVLNITNLIVAALIAQAMFGAFGIGISFWAGLLIGVFGTLSGYINLTPANLGIKEIFLASISELLGFSFTFGIAAATLNRLVEASVILVLAPGSAYWLGKITRTNV